MGLNANYEEFPLKLAKKISGTLFNVEARLPDNVFRKSFQEYRFCHFDLVMAEEFWNELRMLLDLSGQESLVCGLIDPDPAIYMTHVNKTGFVSIGKNANPSDYIHALTKYVPDDDVANFYLSALTLVWMVESLEWGLWGERDCETCILGCSSDLAQKIDNKSESFMKFSEIKVVFDDMPFRGQIWKKFGEDIQKNYFNT